MSTYIIREYRTTFEYGDDGDRTELSSYSEDFNQVPDKWDIEDGRTDHVTMAIDFLKHSAYVIEASVSPAKLARRGTWLSAEPYHNPYCSDVEETTYHFEGDWTDAEIRHIVVTVMGGEDK